MRRCCVGTLRALGPVERRAATPARERQEAKDQSYFLWGLPAELLYGLHFPLGGLTKSEVRAQARKMGLANADKPESQEICFVPTGNYRDLLEKRLLPVHPALSRARSSIMTGEFWGVTTAIVVSLRASGRDWEAGWPSVAMSLRSGRKRGRS